MFRGAKKRTFRFGKKNVSFPKVETFRFADYTLMELSFKENSKYNLYLLGFVSLVLMNTFENGLVSNGGFSVLAYMLISLAYCFNWKSDEFNW